MIYIVSNLNYRENFFLAEAKNQRYADAIYSMLICFFLLFYFRSQIIVEYIGYSMLKKPHILLFRTKTGMTSASESITESLRRTRQLMVQVMNSTYLLSYQFISCFFNPKIKKSTNNSFTQVMSFVISS